MNFGVAAVSLVPRAAAITRLLLRCYISIILVIAVTLKAPAQTPPDAQMRPDAGALLQRAEQGKKLTPAIQTMPEKNPTASAQKQTQKQTNATLNVKEFRFSGNSRISSELLRLAVEQYLERPLAFAQLQEAAAAVGQVYREAGWVVRAYIPEQQIDSGIVTIEVIEAVFGSCRFAVPAATRFSNSAIQKYVAAAQRPGEPLNASAIDRVLLLLSAIPGVSIEGSLHEGKSAAQTDLVFNTQNKPLLAGDVVVDNTGSRATGDKRLAASAYLNSPMGRGDQLGANLVYTEGSTYGRLAYSLPVGFDGWRIGASGSLMGYKLVAPELLGLKAKGTSSTTGLDANYPIIRSHLKNLYLALNYDRKFFHNEIDSATTSDYHISTKKLGLSAELTDKYYGGGTNNFGLSWLSGTVNLRGSPNAAADALTAQTAGQFSKLHYSASRLQTIKENLALSAALSGQIASKNLDSAEKFSIGGTGGVRAYSSSEGSGSVGQMVNIELRALLPHAVGFTGFYDWGRVTVNHHNNFFGAPTLNTYQLQGYGVSASWLAAWGINLKVTWARRLGRNSNPTATGQDQDGSLHINRFWLQANSQF